jgi:hypothetical protein
MRAIGRLPAVLVAAAVALTVAALASLAPGSPLVSSCAGAGSGHAAVVVQHGDGSVVTRCVSFGTGTITGEQLLDASGVAWFGQTFGGYGVAVCALDAEPAHYASCPGQDSYWAIFVSRGGGAWQLSSIGISSLTLGDGDAEGFRYVPAAGNPAAPPSPAGVCAAAAPTAQATAAAHPPAGPAIASPTATAAATVPGSSVAAASAPATARAGDSTLVAMAGSSATVGSPAPAAASPAPSPGHDAGLDPGLLAAALAGGGLAGLALLRLAAARRRAT